MYIKLLTKENDSGYLYIVIIYCYYIYRESVLDYYENVCISAEVHTTQILS
jgi:hypothetical protein